MRLTNILSLKKSGCCHARFDGGKAEDRQLTPAGPRMGRDAAQRPVQPGAFEDGACD
jgi:hypothetical protein